MKNKFKHIVATSAGILILAVAATIRGHLGLGIAFAFTSSALIGYGLMQHFIETQPTERYINRFMIIASVIGLALVLPAMQGEDLLSIVACYIGGVSLGLAGVAKQFIG